MQSIPDAHCSLLQGGFGMGSSTPNRGSGALGLIIGAPCLIPER